MKNRIIAVIACISMLTLPCTAEAKSDVNVRKVSTAHFGDTDGHWARHYVDRLENMGIVKGDGELFGPDDILTRAEAVTMLMRTDGNTSVSGKTAFADINENDWFYESAVRAERAKIIGGEKFMPYENITRRDMAEWTVKFAIYTGCDVTGGGDFVETCKKYELINDSDEGFLTRAEAAAIITRLIDFKRQYSFYVDYDDGNDDGAGTLNNPFKTVAAATEAAQALAPEMDKDIYIYLKSGYYRLDEPITINAGVSGQNGYSIIYSSYGEGNCVLSGGEKIIGWSLYDGEKNIYRAKVDKGLQSRQMFVNGIRAVRARSDGGLADCTYDSGEMGHTTTDVFLADFKKPSDLEFVYNGQWVQNRIGVEKIVKKNDKISIYMEQGWYNYRHSGNFGGLTPAYYENAYELIDNDGEFYLNSDEGYVYYKPRKNEDLTTAEVILPTVEKLLTVKGNPDNFVKNVSFANLTFAYTTWYYVNEPHGLTTVQNNILNPSEVNDQSYPTAAVNVSAADGVTFEKCRFKSLGINGLNMMSGINNCAVVGCEFGDISGAGMCFGDVANKCKNPVDERIMLKNNEITDNYFHDTPAEFQSSAALTIGFPTNARVANNEFFNTPYSAIHAAIGWQVLYSSVFKDIVFENNYFHEIDTSELYDSGAIYTLGGSGGDDENPIIIRGNYVKNKYRVGGAFYPDEGSSNYLLYDNVIDLRDVKSVDDHWEGDKQSWIFNNPAFSGNIIADNNYVTSEVTMTRANVLVTNTHAYPDADWCPEALDIIDNSGISDNYKYLFPDTLRLYKCNLPETMFADPGDEYKIELDGAEMRKSKPANFADYQVVFSSSDENVADVDDTGKITVKATGKTKINVTVFADGVAKTKTSQLYVGDVPSEAVIQKNFYKLTSGEEGSFDISVLKRFSREKVTEYDVTYESEDKNVATVSADGTVRAVGEGKTNILFNITADGNTIKESVEVDVQNTVPEITGEIDLKAQSVNAENWIYDKNAKVTQGENKLSVGTPGGSVGTAWLTDEKYENELVSFKASLDFSGSAWPAFILRAQTQNDCIGSKNTSYLIIFKEKEIEVQRFTNGGRFVFCGNINGFVPKVNYGIENKYIENAKQYDIKLGAIDVDEGVRLLCYVDGVKVVDVLDDTDGAITQSGYFGICDRVNAITFYGE